MTTVVETLIVAAVASTTGAVAGAGIKRVVMKLRRYLRRRASPPVSEAGSSYDLDVTVR